MIEGERRRDKSVGNMEKWVVLVMLLLSWKIREAFGAKAEITYDGRSLIIDGQRKILFSGSIHYPRSTPQVSVMCVLSSYYASLCSSPSSSINKRMRYYNVIGKVCNHISNLFCIHSCLLFTTTFHISLN